MRASRQRGRFPSPGSDGERRQIMSYSIATLLLRNLSDVFGENDPVRRRAAIDDIWNEDGVFYDPNGGIYRGRDEIDRIAGVIKATHPDFRYQPLSPPEVMGEHQSCRRNLPHRREM